MRISDWSSDVCSSDLLGINVVFGPVPVPGVTLTNGVFAAGEIETSVEAEAGAVVHAVVLFAANDDGSQLLCYIDEGIPRQLPMTLIAGKVYVDWKSVVSGQEVSGRVGLGGLRHIKKK